MVGPPDGAADQEAAVAAAQIDDQRRRRGRRAPASPAALGGQSSSAPSASTATGRGSRRRRARRTRARSCAACARGSPRASPVRRGRCAARPRTALGTPRTASRSGRRPGRRYRPCPSLAADGARQPAGERVAQSLPYPGSSSAHQNQPSRNTVPVTTSPASAHCSGTGTAPAGAPRRQAACPSAPSPRTNPPRGSASADRPALLQSDVEGVHRLDRHLPLPSALSLILPAVAVAPAGKHLPDHQIEHIITSDLKCFAFRGYPPAPGPTCPPSSQGGGLCARTNSLPPRAGFARAISEPSAARSHRYERQIP